MMSTSRSLYIFPLIILIAGLFASVLAVGVVQAQEQVPEGPTDDQVNAVAKQLYCPVCENIPLDVCPTKACEQWREVIRAKLSEGWTEEQIKGYFIEQYGDRVSATPPATGFNWMVYVIPPVVILLGAYILLRAFGRWRRPPSVTSPATELPSEDRYVAQLEEELRRLD